MANHSVQVGRDDRCDDMVNWAQSSFFALRYVDRQISFFS
jgi:hypothetical protein